MRTGRAARRLKDRDGQTGREEWEGRRSAEQTGARVRLWTACRQERRAGNPTNSGLEGIEDPCSLVS